MKKIETAIETGKQVWQENEQMPHIKRFGLAVLSGLITIESDAWRAYPIVDSPEVMWDPYTDKQKQEMFNKVMAEIDVLDAEQETNNITTEKPIE